jgi:hypothetical protein
MKEEEHIFVQIIKDSNKRLQTLQIVSNFFNSKDLINVVIKTKIIHNLFQKNRSLDCNKLELFHLQFTDSVIELFQKLKKSKEQQYLLVSDEIQINEEIIAKLKTEVGKSDFPEKAKIHAQEMSKKIQHLYQMFVTDKLELFSWNEIMSFSNSIQSKYYREISVEQYGQLMLVDRNVYQNKNAIFEKKLLGRLNILQFRIKFLCGLVCNHQVIEVYEFRDSNDKFIFVGNDKSFYFLESENAKGIDLSKNSSTKNEVLFELKSKNTNLKTSLETIKTSLSETVKQVLKDYLDKISSTNFTNDLHNVDEQTNILKTMLNININ